MIYNYGMAFTLNIMTHNYDMAFTFPGSINYPGLHEIIYHNVIQTVNALDGKYDGK